MKSVSLCGAASIAIATLVVPALASAPVLPKGGAGSSQAITKPTATAPSAAKPTTPSSVTGTWTGQVQEAGRDGPFPMVLSIDTKTASTTYPDQGCVGKLTRIGGSGGYVFYAEKISKGAYDKATGKGCLDGTLVMTRAGNNVLMGWFGVLDGKPYQASATLTPPSTPKV